MSGCFPDVALSIRQPWAWAILYAGKDIENRSWRTSHRGPILIHAGIEADDEDGFLVDDFLYRALHLGLPGNASADPLDQRGGIVGMVDIDDVVTGSSSEWFTGRYGFVLRNPRPLVFTPCRGKTGIFRPDIDVGALQEVTHA
jgi:hypothetical protein